MQANAAQKSDAQSNNLQTASMFANAAHCGSWKSWVHSTVSRIFQWPSQCTHEHQTQIFQVDTKVVFPCEPEGCGKAFMRLRSPSEVDDTVQPAPHSFICFKPDAK